jgi:glycosyltransferase involved in cell wall biosynthesis
MFNNITSQTFVTRGMGTLEWIIVDDYKTDRSKVCNKYVEKYKTKGLEVKYLWGKPRKVKRTYGLVSADNIGYKESTGQLIVILQDFMLMAPDAIEQLFHVNRHYPNSLIAPVDILCESSVKPDITKEDWFNGELFPIGKLLKTNVRINNKGLRYTNHPYDFEQNFGAIPRHIIDDLGGWYEFMDEGLGFDNTEFAWRALKKGYTILVDETNCVTGISHWEPLKNNQEELGIGRERNLNDPRYFFMMMAVESKLLPLKVTQEVNDSIELLYTMPKDVEPNKWINENGKKIATQWYYKLKKEKSV